MSRFKARFEAIYSICFVILPDVTCKLHSISLTHVYINSQIAFFQYCFFLLPFLNTDSFFLLLFVCRADYQYNPRGSSASVKKRILITHNLRLLKIKTKDYGKGQTLHNFMLEEVGNLYPSFLFLSLYLFFFFLFFLYYFLLFFFLFSLFVLLYTLICL